MTIHKPLPKGQYVEFSGKPDYLQIAMHYTAGFSAISSWNGWVATTERVGTPFLVERNGDRYQTVDTDKGWLWHLGGDIHIVSPYNKLALKSKRPLIMTPAEVLNRRSIGIELANIGHLTLKGDTLHSYVGEFCKLTDKHKYWKSPKPWRGFQYWERYPLAQLESARELVRELSKKYDIPLALLPASIINEVCPFEASIHRGVLNHHNYLGKLDAGIQLDMGWLVGP